ncbi:MAG: phosphoribosylformylglycinamidine synthase subunit PurL, partial [Akkermansia sp.]|nr:phosphoribosylformylglycinamidine synthase subunit PurL [Akkermansia sp.]
VQIGNPLEEKKTLDVILEARERGLIEFVTDCGAGGFSSAAGEMLSETGGNLYLERAPLKETGMLSWQIFLSESQERMVLAVKPENLEELQSLADTFQTEMTVLGESNDSGVLRVWHNGELVVEMDNSKLHDAPTKYLTSTFTPCPALQGVTLDDSNLTADLKQVFGDFAIVSREPIIREYDHEVQGNTVLKPLAGATADAPQDASVIDIDGSDKLMSLALAILPEWGKTDPYAMGTGTVDETVRQLVLAGTNPDKIALLDNFCMGNPECPSELGRIVECAKGIRTAALADGAPYVSGKDSFYNYFETEDGPVNIPVTFLCSGFGVVEDPDHVRGASLRRNNSAIFMVGNTEDEMGASVYARIKGVKDCKVPQTDCAANFEIYKQYYSRALTQGLVLSAHDLSEGGLAVAAAEMAFSCKGGISIDLDKLPTVGGWQNNAVPCFAESTGRFLVEVDEDMADDFATAMAGTPCARIGSATTDGKLTITAKGSTVLQAEIAELKSIWKNGLTPFY